MCILEKCVFCCTGWAMLYSYKSIKFIWSDISFKVNVFLLTLCLNDLSTDVSEALKYPSIIMLLSVSPCRSLYILLLLLLLLLLSHFSRVRLCVTP